MSRGALSQDLHALSLSQSFVPLTLSLEQGERARSVALPRGRTPAPKGLGHVCIHCMYRVHCMSACSVGPAHLLVKCVWARDNRRFRSAASRGELVGLWQPEKAVSASWAVGNSSAFCFFLRPGNSSTTDDSTRALPSVIHTVQEAVPEHGTTGTKSSKCSRSCARVCEWPPAGKGEWDPEGGESREGLFVPCYLQFRSKESSRSQRFQDPFPVGPPAESKFK